MHKTIKKNMKRKTSKKRGLKKRMTKKQVGGAESRRPPTQAQKALATKQRDANKALRKREKERKPVVPSAGGGSSSMSPLIGSRAPTQLVAEKPETPQLVYLPPSQFTVDDVENLLKQYAIKLGNNIPFTSQEVANLVALYKYGYLNGTGYLYYYQYLDGPDNPVSLSKAKIIQANLLKAAKEYKKKYDILEAAENLKVKNSQKSELKKMATIKTTQNLGPDDAEYKDDLNKLHKFDEILQNKINSTNERTDKNPEGRADLTLDEQLELQEYYKNPILRKLIDGGSFSALQSEAAFIQREHAKLMKIQITEDQKRQKIEEMIRKGQTQSLFGPTLTPAQKQEAIYVQKRLAAEKEQKALLTKQRVEIHKQLGLQAKQAEDAERVQQILTNKSTRGTRATRLPSTSKSTFLSSDDSMSEDSLNPPRRLSRATTASGLQGYGGDEDEDEDEDEEEETTSQYSSDQIKLAQEGAVDGIQTAAGLAVLAATAITGIGVIGMVGGGGGKKSKRRRHHMKHGKKRHTKRGHK